MNRLWFRSSVLLLCLVQFTLVSKFSQADDRASGEKLFPKETLAFFTISDVPELKKKWEKTSVGQMLNDPQMKPFLDDFGKKMEEWSKDVEDEIGVSINSLLELPKGELAFALLEQPARKISAVLLFEYGDNQETVVKLLKKMDDELEQEETEHSTEEIDDVTVHVYTFKNAGPDNPYNTLAYFMDKSCLVVSNEIAALKEVLERWDGKSDDTLAQNDQFSYIQAQCKPESGEPLIKMFVNPIGMIHSGIAMAQSVLPQAGMAIGFLPMLGLDGLKGWGGTVDFFDEGEFEGVGNFYLYCDSSSGLLGMFNFPAAQLSPPKWVPATVGSYLLMNWNAMGAYTSIENLIDSFQGKGATARLLEQAAGEGPMIHIKKDILDHLDGKIHFIQSAKEAEVDAPPIPEIFVAFGLKDATKMKKTLAAAAKTGGSSMEARDFNGETIYDIQQPGADTVVSLAVTEGQLVITNDTPMLEELMRGKSSQRATLVDSPDYKKIAKFFPSKTSMLSFQRSDVQLKMYYNLLKKADRDALDGLDVSKLPPFEAISKYFQPSGGYSVPDKKGAKSATFSLKRVE